MRYTKEEIIKALENIRKIRCCYAGDRCDCKFGAHEADNIKNEVTGCPELRMAIGVLTHMNEGEWFNIHDRASGKVKIRRTAEELLEETDIVNKPDYDNTINEIWKTIDGCKNDGYYSCCYSFDDKNKLNEDSRKIIIEEFESLGFVVTPNSDYDYSINKITIEWRKKK